MSVIQGQGRQSCGGEVCFTGANATRAQKVPVIAVPSHSHRPLAFVLCVCFGTALRAGGAPPLYPAFARVRTSRACTSQRELRPLRTSPVPSAARSTSQGSGGVT